MIRINLMPYRVARRQQQIMQHVGVFFAVVVLSALGALGAHTYMSMQLSDLKERTLALQKQNEELKSKIGKIENLATLRADVEHKLKIVDYLQEGRFRSLKSLNGIAEEIPENVWLISVQDKGSQIDLTGYAESNQAVANFMRKLDHSEIFEDIRLGAITRMDMNGLPVRRFNLSMARVGDLAVKQEAQATGKRRSR